MGISALDDLSLTFWTRLGLMEQPLSRRSREGGVVFEMTINEQDQSKGTQLQGLRLLRRSSHVRCARLSGARER